MLACAERITCLTTDTIWLTGHFKYTFVNLSRLKIVTYDSVTYQTYDMSNFPKLVHLDLANNRFINKILDFSRCVRGMAQLRYLSLGVDIEKFWLNVIGACNATLTTLVLHAQFAPRTSATWGIQCPMLQHFVLKDMQHVVVNDNLYWTYPKNVVVLGLLAPRLTYYEYHSKEGLYSIEFIAPLNKIVHVRTSSCLPLDMFPALQILQLEESTSVLLEIVEQLEKNLDLCKSLETLEMIVRSRLHNEFVRHVVRQRLAARNERTGGHISVIFSRIWTHDSPIDQYEI